MQVRNKQVGIRSDSAYWSTVFGSVNGCSDVGNYPLWYVSENGYPDFQDFKSFGGFKVPKMKTYNTMQSRCGV